MADNRQLALSYGHRSPKPAALLNSIFMSTVKTAAKTLVAVASASKSDHIEKWKPMDHMRFMLMMMTWLTVWFLRVLMDYFPFSGIDNYSSSSAALSSPCAIDHHHQYGLSKVGSSLDLLASSSSSVLSSAMSVFSSGFGADSSLEWVLSEEVSEVASVKALGRALTNIFALLNEMPASSTKYQFAVAMADRIVDENLRGGRVELHQINRAALASAFARTSGILYRSLQTASHVEDCGPWVARVVRALPLGAYVSFFMKGLGAVFPVLSPATRLFLMPKQPVMAGGERVNDVAAEKHAQELLWITNKMRGCGFGAVDEALVQWSWASGLASSALTANSRVQALIVKITAILFGELRHANLEEMSVQVKFRTLALWLPVFSYAGNGLSYPVLSSYEKAELERILVELISSLPAFDQEVILTNWLQDFTNTSSDWPNLQAAYDKWCHSARNLII